MRKRQIKKQFYLNENEAASLKEKSDMCGLPEATVLRMLITGFHPKPKPDEEFYRDMRVLYAVSNNLNQLAVRSHTYDYIDTDELQDILKELSSFINDIQKKYLVPDSGG